MIPIFDLRGNVIAFSGRKLDPEQPGGKYVNSPETLVYKKSRTLFALNFAKNPRHGGISCARAIWMRFPCIRRALPQRWLAAARR